MRKKTIISFFALSLLLPLSALAVTNAELRAENKEMREEMNEQRKETRTELNEQRKAMLEQRCAFVTARIKTRLGNYEEKKAQRLKIYENIKTKLESVIKRFEDDGYDVTQLKSDLEVLKGKVKKLGDDYAVFIDKLEASQNFECGKSEGQFANRYSEARSAMLDVRQDMLDVRSYFTNTIRADVKALRAQKVEDKKDANDGT